MDRSTVRIILIIIGALVLAGVYLWPGYRERVLAWWNDWRARRQAGGEESGDGEVGEGAALSSAGAYGEDYLAEEDDDLPPLPPNRRDSYWQREEPLPPPPEAPLPVSRPKPAPMPTHTPPAEERRVSNLSVVQLSVVAVDDAFFTGGELEDAFDYVGLRYGEMGIFHRYGDDNKVLFSVASMVEPGTFPVNDMLNFESPGVVLFFQASHVDDPVDVFDNLVTCCHELAIRLNGVEWDAERRPLTTGKIVAMRNALGG